jgi:cytochrome c biogenesis protein CcdA
VSEIQEILSLWLEAVVRFLPVSYAFGAGMVSTVNPCGFVMLPAYLSLYLGAGDSAFAQRSTWSRTLLALGVGLTASAGFVVLFAIIGAGVSAGGSFLIPAMPWLAVAIGISLVVVGIAMLAGRALPAGFIGRAASRLGNPRTTGIAGVFLFGMAFAAASLSCTLPIFLGVVGSALTSGGFVSGVIQFVSYALGMGLVLVVLTLAIALLKEGIIVSRLRSVLPYVERVAAALVLLAGSYIVYYWLFKAELLKMLVLGAALS